MSSHWSDESSTWKLKSPVISSLPVKEISDSKNEENSSKNREYVKPFVEDDGGRYTVTIWKYVFGGKSEVI